LIGIAVGYAASAYFGLLDLASVIPKDGMALVHIPSIKHIGYSFDPIVLLPFIVAAFASTLRAMGDITNCQRLNDKDWVRPDMKSLVGGVAANGLASIFCGLAGSSGPNTYSSSVRLSARQGSPTDKWVTSCRFYSFDIYSSGRGRLCCDAPPVMGHRYFSPPHSFSPAACK
jgi:NCS2 family nucleobase:cation symporter-2